MCQPRRVCCHISDSVSLIMHCPGDNRFIDQINNSANTVTKEWNIPARVRFTMEIAAIVIKETHFVILLHLHTMYSVMHKAPHLSVN